MKRQFRSLALLSLASAALSAQASLFDFESSTATFFSPPDFNRPGSYTSLSQTDGGLTLVLTRDNKTAFDVVDNNNFQGGKPASWGDHSLDPFFDAGSAGWIGNFSGLVSSVSLDWGDYGADDDTLTMNVYSGLNGTGTLLGSVSGSITSLETFVGHLSIAAAGIQSFTLQGTSSAPGFDNSVFIDNISARPMGTVPGPAAAVSFALLALRRRRKA